MLLPPSRRLVRTLAAERSRQRDLSSLRGYLRMKQANWLQQDSPSPRNLRRNRVTTRVNTVTQRTIGPMHIVLIIPTFNERGSMGNPIDQLQVVYQSLPQKMQVLLADDNSPNGTIKIIREQLAPLPNVHTLRVPEAWSRCGLTSPTCATRSTRRRRTRCSRWTPISRISLPTYRV
jgi:hypothetical protein